MPLRATILLALTVFGLTTFPSPALTCYVDVNSTNPVPPYATWDTAATNIQNAIVSAGNGGTVLVTNGIYQYGGDAFSNSSNRIDLTGQLVQSINGPQFTIIQGGGSSNNITAVRCARIQGGKLSGFTLTGGMTYSGNGAGVLGANTNFCLVTNCVIVSNSATASGGGACFVTLANCILSGNIAIQGSSANGGGAYLSLLVNCLVTSNFSSYVGGAAGGSTLLNCTVVNNSTAAYDASLNGSVARNSIIYSNYSYYSNVDNSTATFVNCCLSFTGYFGVGSTNNIYLPPYFLDPANGNYRLSNFSPCINHGSNALAAASTDLDGNPRIFGSRVDIGAYENQLNQSAHTLYVNLGNANPAPPFYSWDAAATNIQDAVDLALAGDLILVTNGLYNVGGRAQYGAMTNRVLADKALTLQSVNGPAVTTIAGFGDRTTPGIRCVYLADGASLTGFTLTNGTTRFSGDGVNEMSGGNVFCESSNVVISNCVLTGGFANQNGGGAFRGALYACILTNNTAYARGGGACSNLLSGCSVVKNFALFQNTDVGGGAVYSTLSNCLIVANVCNGGGGGAASASTLVGCVLSNNFGNNGGGTTFSTVSRCLISSNRSFSGGGGSYSDTLIDCVLAKNLSSGGGAALSSVLINCTVISNSTTSGQGGGLVNDNATNCIVYYNQGASGSNYFNSFLSYCQTAPLPTNGIGNLTNAPFFVNLATADYHLRFLSTSLDLGTNLPASGPVDLDGNPRIFNGITDLGAYEYQGARHATLYVNASNTTPVSPFMSWPTAATNIQNAVDAALDGDQIIVTNGIYSSTARIEPASNQGDRVFIDKFLSVQSVNGPAVTIIAGAPGGIRCAYLANGASLYGFTLTNGLAGSGGGVWCDSVNSVVSNCVLGGNSAINGGGAFGGHLIDCLLLKNQATGGPGPSAGGGTASNLLDRCVLAGNSATFAGGGAAASTLVSCTVSNNTASSYGGGAWLGSLDHCLVLTNLSHGSGGGSYGAILGDSAIVNNRADGSSSGSGGGGAFGGTLSNCTLVGNISIIAPGGGARSNLLYNCIVYNNYSPNGTNYQACTFFNSCTLPFPTNGTGNFTNDPAFIDWANLDVHLQSNSPCINSGNNAYAPFGTDLDGNPRIAGGFIDVGAYEFQSPASGLPYIWLQQFGLPLDGTADHADTDGDGLDNSQEWLAGTDPTNPADVLKISDLTNDTTGITVTWLSATNRLYFIGRATDFTVQPPFVTLQSNITGQTGTTSYTDTNTSGSGPFFYRVGLQ